MTGPISTWVAGESCYPVPPLCIRHFHTDFLQRCLSTPENGDHTTPHLPSLTPLLREWAKSKLTGGSWRGALDAAFKVSIPFVLVPLVDLTLVGLEFTTSRFTIYWALCDHLETTDRVTDAVECFHQMTAELGGEMNLHGEHSEWALGE